VLPPQLPHYLRREHRHELRRGGRDPAPCTAEQSRCAGRAVGSTRVLQRLVADRVISRLTSASSACPTTSHGPPGTPVAPGETPGRRAHHSTGHHSPVESRR